MTRAIHRRASGSNGRFGIGLAILAGAGLAGAAVVNARLARKAERENPPTGQFVEVDGVRLHYVDKGHGEPLVLIHGNGTSTADFATSGLLDMAATRYRVIAFDRPGFGYSERPRTTVWTQYAQAELIYKAMAKIGIVRATILGHSWGCSVALALADRRPRAVRSLVLASGYYFPTPRQDAVMASVPAVPLLGDVVRHTVSPVLSRLLWPALLRKLFGPAEVPAKFDEFPKELAFRPSQILASAGDSALMVPDAIEASRRYGAIATPTVIIAGDDDRIVDFQSQSMRLDRALPNSVLTRVPGTGHMVHQTATEAVMSAIDKAIDMSLRSRS